MSNNYRCITKINNSTKILEHILKSKIIFFRNRSISFCQEISLDLELLLVQWIFVRNAFTLFMMLIKKEM